MDKETKKLSWFDKLRLKAMMPNLKKYRRKYSDGLKPEDNYVLVKRTDYELMQKMVDRQDNYLAQIKMNNEEIGKLRDTNEDMVGVVKDTLNQLKQTEQARKKNASKIGGLTTSLNKEKNKTKELLNTVNELEDNIKDLEVKLEESMSDKYLVRKLPAGRRPKTQTMKLKSCTVQSNIARKMFGDNK